MHSTSRIAAAVLGFVLSTIPHPYASAEPEAAPLVVMNLAAHPDDEDGSTLAYFRHGRDAVAYSVIFTRGEGGQNEIGPELYEELGAIRTTETERAARQLGTQVYFLNFKDFGFSKSAEETFERWGGKDEVTSRLVYLIRKLKPDLLFTNHDTVTVGPGRQHGHHQAVGIAAYEAFELASDSTYHPEQLDEKGVDLWQPKRLYRRLWEAGDHDAAVPVGDRDPETGAAYSEIAGEALYAHASQGMDRFARRVMEWDRTYFVEYRSATDAPSSATDLAAGLEPNRAAEPDVSYWIDSGRLPKLPPGAVTVDDDVAVPGQPIEIRWDVDQLPERPVRLRLFGALDTTITIRADSPPRARLTIDPSETPTIPEKIYQYERYLNHPPVGYAVYEAREGRLLRGGYLPMEIAPAVQLEAEADVVRLHGGENEIPLHVTVYDPDVKALTLAAGIGRAADHTILDQRQQNVTAQLDEPVRVLTRLSLSPDPHEGRYAISLSAAPQDADARPATASDFLSGQVFRIDVPEALRVGVVESYDNTLDRALTELGVDHVMLDSTDLADNDFDDLHTILIDIRAYLVRRDLRRYNDRLLDWVRRGGHLVVNYQKTFEWNTDDPDPFDPARTNAGTFAPYPLELSRLRVTREDAPVDVLRPEHPLFRLPNPIAESDWEGWVQERGLYFPDEYDDRYVELFSLSDPGEDPLRGSTLMADYGEGTYLYTALVWYRQLKEYHPGAYKMFANMISLPLVDDRYAGP